MTERLIEFVDPELRSAAIAMRQAMADYTPMTHGKLLQRREWIASMTPEPDRQIAFETISIARPVGCGEGPEIGAIVVNPKPGEQLPGILHLHGGGFTAGSAVSSLLGVQKLAEALDCTILTVDYRLAPEVTWSGSLADNYAALLWLRDNAASLGIDPGRIAVVGESAGGGHAALLSLVARDRAEVQIIFQALVYPMIDDRTGTSRELAEHIGSFGWNREANRFGWRSFLGCEPGGDDVPVAGVPARADCLGGLPPTWIGVGGMDLFADECIDFAMRLNAAGVATELLLVPGAFHGFDSFAPTAAISRRFTQSKLDALRRGLGLGGAIA